MAFSFDNVSPVWIGVTDTRDPAVYPVPFRFLQNADLRVYLDGALLAEGAGEDYTVVGAGLESGQEITLNVVPAAGLDLVLARATTIETPATWGQNAAVRAGVLNFVVNTITAWGQEVASRMGRAIRLKSWDDAADLELPVKADRANKYVKFDASGDLIAADGTDGTSVTDHGELTGLADDDHTQYHTDARGDARYYPQATVDAALAGKSATSHDHAASYAALSHAASHQHGGGDEIATATPAANAIPKAGAGGTLDAGWLPGSSGGGGLTPQAVTIVTDPYALAMGKMHIVTSNDESGAALPEATSAGSVGLINATAVAVAITPDGGDTITVNEHAGLTSLTVPPRGLRVLHTTGNGVWHDETAKQVWQAAVASAEFVEIRAVDGTVIGGFNSDSTGGFQVLVAKNGTVTGGISSGHGHIWGPMTAPPGNPTTAGELYAFLLNGLITAKGSDGQQFQMLANKMPKKSVTATPYSATWNDGWLVLSGSADVVNLPAATNSWVMLPITNDTATAVTVNRNGTDQMLTENGSGQTTFDIPAGGTVLVIDETTSSGDDVRVIGTLA